MNRTLHIDETPSTNTWLMEHCREEDYPNLFTVYTFRQTAGRGQAGNAWESEPGKNLSFSTLFRIATIEQAARLNLLVPLAVCNVLNKVKGQTPRGLSKVKGQKSKVEGDFSIKWPNDIYWQDRKVAGLLNENVIIAGKVAFSVAGIGVNVNQEVFLSDAPNPVSLKQITGRTYELEPLIVRIVDEMESLLPLLDDQEALKRAYMARLYRREGWFPYVERDVSTAPTTIARAGKTNEEKHVPFLAEIADIDDFGRLVLRTESGELRTYHFKEIRFVL